MTRLIAAALILGATSVPALACEWMNKTVSTDTQPSTVAQQPAPAQSTPAVQSPPATQSVYTPS